MFSRSTLASMMSVAALLTLGFAAPAQAEDPAKLDQFQTACLGSASLLLSDVPEGADTAKVMTPLCSCMVTEFSGFSQADIDMLTADLSGTATEESHKAYATYEDLSGRAASGLEKCFGTDEVTAAMGAAGQPASQ
jgi:hypothetical protein